jgi:negative regulator of sigma E activity
MKQIESRKQLLIMESELNRAQLIQEWQTMADDVHALTRRAKTISAVASASAVLIAGLSFFGRKKSGTAAEKPAWWQTLLKGAGVARSLWSEFRTATREPKDR